MKSSFGPVVACVLGLGLAMTGATASLAQGGIGQKQGKIVVVKKAPQAAGSHSGKHSGHRHSNRGRNIAAGVAAGVVGAIILNEAARASGGSDRGYSCEALERRCDDGQEWACRRLERNSC